jgi:hypothetical protein
MKRIIVALMVGGMVFGTVFAVAASLGGITSPSLGADSAAVTSCDDSGVSVEWGTHMTIHGDANHPLGGFHIDNFSVGDIAAECAGKHVLVSLTTNGHVQFCISGVIPGGGGSVNFPQAFKDTYDENDPQLPACLNDVTVWADELTDVHIAIKDTPY